MTLDELLAWGQEAHYLLGPPWGQVVSAISGTVRGNLARMQRDAAPLVSGGDELAPILEKHGPALQAFWADFQPWLDKNGKPMLSAALDLVPIEEAVLDEAKPVLK